MKRKVKVLVVLALIASSLTTVVSCVPDEGERPYDEDRYRDEGPTGVADHEIVPGA